MQTKLNSALDIEKDKKYSRFRKTDYRNDPNFFDNIQVWTNPDPDHTSPSGVIYMVCHSVGIYLIHYSRVKPHCSRSRILIAIFRGSEFLL